MIRITFLPMALLTASLALLAAPAAAQTAAPAEAASAWNIFSNASMFMRAFRK